jgi:hypothetical protein
VDTTTGVGAFKATGPSTGAAIGLIVVIIIGMGGSRTAGTLRSGAAGLSGSHRSRTLVMVVSAATSLSLRGARGEPGKGCFRAWTMS